MKTLLIILLTSLSLFANIGKITGIKGEVYIDRDNDQIVAKVGSILELKDKVVTKDSSKALLLFNDQTSITVGKNSSLEVQKYVFNTQQTANNEAQFKFGQGFSELLPVI